MSYLALCLLVSGLVALCYWLRNVVREMKDIHRAFDPKPQAPTSADVIKLSERRGAR